MFEEEKLTLPPEDSYVLYNGRNRPVRGVILPQEVAPNRRLLYESQRKDHHWLHRKDACGTYNCFGMIFANRRAAIFDESPSGRDLIRQILKDDGYSPIPEGQAMPGDIVLFSEAREGYTHAALVIDHDKGGLIPALRVLSKWSMDFGEDIHLLRDHIWNSGPDTIGIEFWTDRLGKEEVVHARR